MFLFVYTFLILIFSIRDDMAVLLERVTGRLTAENDDELKAIARLVTTVIQIDERKYIIVLSFLLLCVCVKRLLALKLIVIYC